MFYYIECDIITWTGSINSRKEDLSLSLLGKVTSDFNATNRIKSYVHMEQDGLNCNSFTHNKQTNTT